MDQYRARTGTARSWWGKLTSQSHLEHWFCGTKQKKRVTNHSSNPTNRRPRSALTALTQEFRWGGSICYLYRTWSHDVIQEGRKPVILTERTFKALRVSYKKVEHDMKHFFKILQGLRSKQKLVSIKSSKGSSGTKWRHYQCRDFREVFLAL